jgi:hypothetical protein
LTTAIKEALDIRYNPGHFARKLGGMHGKYKPTPHQDSVFSALEAGEKRIAVRSSTGTGKTTAIAQLIIWWLSVWKDCKVIITSTKADQLRYQVWAEIHILLKRAYLGIKDGLTIAIESAYRVDNPEGAVAVAKVAPKGEAEKHQGWHHENMMIIVDESSGVEDGTIQALRGCCTGANNILILFGNPTRLTGEFYDAFHKNRSRWHCLHFSGPDSPLVSAEYLQELIDDYGENSNIYRVRGLGEFPKSDSDALISLEWVEAAARRHADPSTLPVVIGIDPARSQDGDATGMIARHGLRVLASRQIWVDDLDVVQGRAKVFRDEVMAAWSDLEWGHFAVEIDGLGAGVYDGLNGTGEDATPVTMGGSPSLRYWAPGDHKPLNMRAELWLAVRDFLKKDGGSLAGLIDTPELDVLMGELCGPRYDTNRNGEIYIEAKKDMKKRGLKSPNLADALCLTFADEPGAGGWSVLI